MIRMLFPLVMMAVLDIYGYQAVKTVAGKYAWIYWLIHGIIYASLIGIFVFGSFYPIEQKDGYLIFSILLAFYGPKMLMLPFLIVEDASNLFKYIAQAFQKKSAEVVDPRGTPITRSKFISQLALGIASLPFMGTIYAILKGKYDYQLRKEKVYISGLPKSFEGYKIVQLSDLHTGSFDNMDAVSRGLKMVNEQKADVILFTGDLVNSGIEETDGFEALYSGLKAKDGVFSVLGNHDYNRKARHLPTNERKAYLKDTLDRHASFGWRLLMNEHQLIKREGDQLAIVGVENWSAQRYFPQLGELKNALQGTEEAKVKVLLSHDPSHWEAEVIKISDIDLTLSGHTHGCQFGIELPGFRWSPIQYLYKQWAGLYREGKQYLYVNRGFGFVGFSGRLGIRPEVAVLELTGKKEA